MSVHPDTPSGAFRAAVAEAYEEPGPAEQAQIDSICRVLDRIAALEAVVEAKGELVEGSRGQDVINPAMPELRQLEVTLGKLLDQLGMDKTETTSRHGRKGARGRWHQ